MATIGPALVEGDQDTQPQASPAVRETGAMAGQWKNWLADPRNSQMLIQTGISMLQPNEPGQSTVGHLASAVGAGFESRDRTMQYEAQQRQQEQELEIKRQAASSEDEVNKAQAGYYARGGAASIQTPETKVNMLSRALADARKSLADFQLMNPEGTPDPPELVAFVASLEQRINALLDAGAGAVAPPPVPGAGAGVASVPPAPAAPPVPGAPVATGASAPLDVPQSLARARAWIAKGGDPTMVKNKLRAAGIDPNLL